MKFVGIIRINNVIVICNLSNITLYISDQSAKRLTTDLRATLRFSAESWNFLFAISFSTALGFNQFPA
jgi:hypothetical protein